MKLGTSIVKANLAVMSEMDASTWSTIFHLNPAWISFCPMSTVYNALEKSSGLGMVALTYGLLSENQPQLSAT